MSERVAVVGSRGWKHMDAVRHAVWALPDDAVVVSGGARGVDSIAVVAAGESGRATDVIRPDEFGIREFGFTKAAKDRNWLIVTTSDRVVAFWDGYSGGTAHTIAAALSIGKPVEVHRA